MKHLDILLKGGRVKRYHTETLISHQTVAEHSWNMVVIIERLWPEASKILILAAVYHDTAEGELGDIPAPTKKALCSYAAASFVLGRLEKDFHSRTSTMPMYNLTPTEECQLKIADYVELILFCQHQYKMGNGHLLQVENKGREYVISLLRDNPSLVQDLSEEKQEWLYDVLGLTWESKQ